MGKLFHTFNENIKEKLDENLSVEFDIIVEFWDFQNQLQVFFIFQQILPVREQRHEANCFESIAPWAQKFDATDLEAKMSGTELDIFQAGLTSGIPCFRMQRGPGSWRMRESGGACGKLWNQPASHSNI